ncbi:fibronectin type III domain-containing protein [Streptomyces turgidiscabies]|uniref:Fibronectin type 3 domain-containing protein n=1 Tax=Streptomyces turgidiscabies TaxID=85558 RepID=A0ABU0RNM3_9ACTN|nr:PA14 domain-containing protein [Streptomyces turgidiscabies]MDQ0933596.1 fibronectin type 3 domain-containing protein [Streptomyces turgidiscabies]
MNPARRTTRAATTALVLATTGALLSTATPAASAATTCAAPAYQRQSFANTTFSGTPKKTDCDSTIAENWGAGSPAPGLPKDNFGVRWTVTRDFGSGGPFTLTAATQDGIRVYVDGNRKVDLWRNVSATVRKAVDVTIPAGKHTLRVDYANWNGNANVNFTYAPRTSATVDKVKPLAPTAPSVTYDKATGKAKLTWAKNKEMDLAGYRIYRRLNGASFGSTPLATTTATTYTDSTLPKTGQTYAYEVRAHDKAGNQSTGSADVSVTTVDKTAPGQVTGLVVTVAASTLRLDWKTVADAFSYSVYRASAPQGPYTRITWAVGDTSYTDVTANIGQRAYYRVTAVDKDGNESVPSATVDPGEPDTTAPAQVTGLTAQGTTAGNAVRWQPSSADVERYEVWAAPVGQSDPDGPDITLGTSFNDSLAEDGVPVTYKVQAIDAYGNISPVSETVTTTRPAPGESAAPTGLTGTLRDSDTQLTWDPSTDARFGYRVYRRTGANDAWTRISEDEGTTVRYDDTEAPVGPASYYVVALDQYGNESAPTGAVTVNRATPATSTGPKPPTITLSAPYTPCTANDCAAHGGSSTPLTVTLTPDPERLIGGYTYRFSGDTGYTTTTRSTVTWTPPEPGLYVFEVRSVDYYGGRGGAFTHIQFKVG